MLADLWYTGNLRNIQTHTSLFCVHIKEEQRMSNVGALLQLPQKAAAGQWHYVAGAAVALRFLSWTETPC